MGGGHATLQPRFTRAAHVLQPCAAWAATLGHPGCNFMPTELQCQPSCNRTSAGPCVQVGMDKEQRALTCDGAPCAYSAPPPSAEEEEARL